MVKDGSRRRVRAQRIFIRSQVRLGPKGPDFAVNIGMDVRIHTRVTRRATRADVIVSCVWGDKGRVAGIVVAVVDCPLAAVVGGVAVPQHPVNSSRVTGRDGDAHRVAYQDRIRHCHTANDLVKICDVNPVALTTAVTGDCRVEQASSGGTVNVQPTTCVAGIVNDDVVD